MLVSSVHFVLVRSRNEDLGVIFMPTEVLLPNCGDVRINAGLGGGSNPPRWGLLVTAITAAFSSSTSSPTSTGGPCFRQTADVPVCVAQDKVVDVRRRLVEVILQDHIIHYKLHGHIEGSASNAIHELADLCGRIETSVVRGLLEFQSSCVDLLPLCNIPLEVLLLASSL